MKGLAALRQAPFHVTHSNQIRALRLLDIVVYDFIFCAFSLFLLYLIIAFPSGNIDPVPE